MVRPIEYGITFPQMEIGDDPLVIKDYAQAIEDLGFDYLTAYDHIIGADRDSRPDWSGLYDINDMFYEPLTLFSYLAGYTKNLRFLSSIIPLPQRQVVLFAKQAANVDVYCGGRLSLGVGLGWNDVEYEALGVNFDQRAQIFEEQIHILRRLWTERNVTERLSFHRITSAGINPMPTQSPIPLYIGAIARPAIERAARIADGWIAAVDASEADEVTDKFHAMVENAGRNFEDVSIISDTHLGTTLGGPVRSPAYAAEAAETWAESGARAVLFSTVKMGHQSLDEHLIFARALSNELQLTRGKREARLH